MVMVDRTLEHQEVGMKKRYLLLGVAAVVVLTAGAIIQTQQVAKVTSNSALIYLEGDLSSELVATLGKNSTVTVVDATSMPGWTKIKVEGWVRSSSIVVAPPQVAPPPPAAADPTVYITRTGTKYHRTGCRYLSRSRIPIKLSDAKRRGYTPCSVCKPPTATLSTGLTSIIPSKKSGSTVLPIPSRPDSTR